MKRKQFVPEVLRFLVSASEAISSFEYDAFHSNTYCFLWDKGIDSPIEQVLYTAIKVLGKINFLIEIDVIETPNGPMSVGLIIFPQKEIGSYRVDFLISYKCPGSLETKSVIVECDSQAFHERTESERRYEKERDRFFATKGYQVFHFTGTEILREPYRVAAEILAYVTSEPVEEYTNSIVNLITEENAVCR